MKLLRLEFYKCRRRKILLVCAAVLAVELIWMGAFLARQDEEDFQQGWLILLYNLAMVDAIVLPLSVATMASRNCELEHKGCTWKVLETMVSAGSIYTAKLSLSDKNSVSRGSINEWEGEGRGVTYLGKVIPHATGLRLISA